MAVFKYKPKKASTIRRRANDTGSLFDSYIRSDIVTFSPKEGSNIIRILPDTWEGEDSYFGFEIWVHYSIGPDESPYLCLKKMKNQPCPICEALTEAKKAGDEEMASRLRPTKRVAAWIIDRDAQKDGPKLWAMPKTIEKDIAMRMLDRKTGKVLAIDHPEEGYDISFFKEGSGRNTKYIGLEISREPTPISENPKEMEQILQFIVDNPVPDVLVFYDYDYIKNVLYGATGFSKKDEEPVTKTSFVKKTKTIQIVEEDDKDELTDENPLEEDKVVAASSDDEEEEEEVTNEVSRKLEELKRRFASRG